MLHSQLYIAFQGYSMSSFFTRVQVILPPVCQTWNIKPATDDLMEEKKKKNVFQMSKFGYENRDFWSWIQSLRL